MNGWFIALLVIYVLSLGINLGKHGQPNESKYNFGLSLVMTSIIVTLIYMAVKTGF